VNRAMGNFAAVDCGTLSTRLLISAPTGEPILRSMRITRLGEGVDRSRLLLPEAIERTLVVLREYQSLMGEHEVQTARMVGTSALRDASNRALFSKPAAELIGTEVDLLSGQDEAALSFLGATAELSAESAPWLVADIGGGSTELVVGPRPFGACSLDLGCVRVTERFLQHDPPTRDELANAEAWLKVQYNEAESEVPGFGAARVFVGLSGTVSALARFDQGLVPYDRKAVHHYRLARQSVEQALADLAGRPAAQRAGLPGIEERRSELIVGGALVLATLMAHFDFDECLVSESDILDGLVITMCTEAGDREAAPPLRDRPSAPR
jgi:exopolyphosphatase / guanosine-5'-triphosphate,3'-diphosphate pyrophosphatase